MEKVPTNFDRENWKPKTEIGKKVKNGEITSVEEIFNSGKIILEPEIIDALLPNLYFENIYTATTQRVTDSGRKTKFRVVVVVGDANGHVGVGVGKAEEFKPALEAAIKNGKKNIISVKRGCGSWECRCNEMHSIPQATKGKEGSTVVILKPAPKGLGLAANDTIKKVLTLAGIKDIWSTALGSTKNVYNTAVATVKALNNLNERKFAKEV